MKYTIPTRSLWILFLLWIGWVEGQAQNFGALFTNETTAKEIFYSGNMREATRHFEELLRVDSLHYEYNMMCGYAYLHSNLDKSRAIVHYLRTLKNPKADSYIYYDLGCAYHLCYQFDKAIEAFNTFIAKKGKSAPDDIPAERCIEMCQNAQLLMNLRDNVTLEPLPSTINTPYPDLNAYIDEDETLLHFVSRQPQNSGQPDYDGLKMADIYCSEWQGSGWSKAKRLQPPINSSLTERVVGLSPDATTMLLYCNNDKGYDDLFISHRDKKNYGRPEHLGFNVNSEYREEAAMVTPDGEWIFFSSDRPGGYGGWDIYYAKRLPNGAWSSAHNAGPNINTPYDDSYPYIAPDGQSFYFCSQGHNSMGGFDLFRCTWDATTQYFSIPENLAFPINTPDDNLTISISKSGRYGYIADFRPQGTGDVDIYRVTFQDVAKPNWVYRGLLEGADSVAAVAAPHRYKVIAREAGSKSTIGVYRPNPHDGSFTLILSPGLYLLTLYIDEQEAGQLRHFVADREPGKEIPIIHLQKQQ